MHILYGFKASFGWIRTDYIFEFSVNHTKYQLGIPGRWRRRGSSRRFRSISGLGKGTLEKFIGVAVGLSLVVVGVEEE